MIKRLLSKLWHLRHNKRSKEHRFRNKFLTAGLIFTLCLSAGLTGQPTDNPVASYYSGTAGYASWTDNIKWNNVIDMSTYANGSNAFQKFENARDELYSQGGGVLYYPAGTYDFTTAPVDGPNGRGLMLKKGVVIRGATPTGDKNGADGTLDLTTVFNFKFNTQGGGQVPADWNLIGLMRGTEELKDINNVGICWVKLNGAAIYFGAQMTWGATYSTAGGWLSSQTKNAWKDHVPDGTNPFDPFVGCPFGTFQGAGKGRLVFGCILENSTVNNNVYNPGFGESGFYMYKFGARIGVYGSNVLVANNVLPKSNKNFKYTQTTCNTWPQQNPQCGCASTPASVTVLYDYGKTFGVDINKDYLNVTSNKLTGYMLENVVVQDNYVYNHGTKGFDVSGQWAVIKNNRNERDFLTEGDDVYGLGAGWTLTLDGFIESAPGGNGCISDNLSRAFDLAGRALWIDGNSWNNTGSDPGNDGESILCQADGGTQLNSWAVTHNTYLPSYNETKKGYLSGFGVNNYGMLAAWNNTKGTVGNLANGDLYDCAFIASGANESVAFGYTPAVNDAITACPSGTPAAPTGITVATVIDGVSITWTDASNNEIGYRVERRVAGSGTWATIAYRPRKSQGTVENEQKWVDYLAPRNKDLEYRVVAVNCADDNSGASAVSAVVKLLGGVPPVTNVDPTTLLPNAAGLASIQARIDNLLGAGQYWGVGKWDCNRTARGDADNGKRYWPLLLAQLKLADASGRATLIANEGHSGVFATNEGQLRGPFAAPGLSYYYYKYFDELPQDQKDKVESNWNSVNRGYCTRTDGHMDPIYNCTEFNSENYNWMNRMAGYNFAHKFNDNTLVEGVPAQQWFTDYTKNQIRATFNAGRVEWNSHAYGGFSFQSASQLYEFSADASTKMRGRALMDWMSVETALRYLDLSYVGPESRDKASGYEYMSGSITPYYYTFFYNEADNSFTNTEIQQRYAGGTSGGQQTVGFLAHMTYRPLQIAIDIAQRKFAFPVEMRNAKPFYRLDYNNYAGWKGDVSNSRRNDFETTYLEENYTLSSLSSNRPYKDKTFLELCVWRLGVTQPTGGALQIFGNTGSNVWADPAGRSPYEEVGQFRNVMMRLIKGATSAFVSIPTSKNPAYDGNYLFVDMGSGVYVAVTPYGNTTANAGVDFAGTHTKFVWNFSASDLVALIMEVGTVKDHGSFANFKNKIKNNTTITTPAANQVQYGSTLGNTLKMEFMPTTTYQFQDNDANCSIVTVDPAGVLPKVWGDGTYIDFNTWNSYEVVLGEKIVSQEWGSGIMKLEVGGKGVQISVDPVTAEVKYGTYTPGATGLNPTIVLDKPANDTIFTSGSNVLLSATASDKDGTVTQVEFFKGDESLGLGTKNGNVYSMTWNSPADGEYAITAKATDNDGLISTTPVATINVGNVAPLVSITAPLNNALYVAGSNVTINANASDRDGTVSKVEFYQGSNKLGEDLTSPYTYTWNNVSLGDYVLTAKATDNAGAERTSTAVTIFVNELPTVNITSPSNNTKYPKGTSVIINATAADSDGTIAKVEFYQGANKIGEDLSSPYTYTWVNPPSNSYVLTAKATDNKGGATTSSAINIVVSSYYDIPGRIEAENYSAMSGVQLSGTVVGWIDDGDWMDYKINVPTAKLYTFNYRVASPNSNTKLTMRKGGTDLHTITVPNTGSWNTWASDWENAYLEAGEQTLRVFATKGGFNFDWFEIVEVVPLPVTGVTVSPTATNVAVNNSLQLTATIAPAKATNKTVSWTTSNAAVATVSSTGLVSALSAGTATITVTTQDGGFTATSEITAVVTAVTGVAISQTTMDITIGGATQQLTASVLPANATNKNVSWSTSNSSVATVNSSGVVTAVAVGTATITVTTQDGNKTATCAVSVNPVGSGDGLRADYYNTMDLSGSIAVTRIETVNFDWGNGAYATGQNADAFSVRWTGQVKPQYTEVYTFETETDDGVRLWVNGTLLVDKWVNQGSTKWTGTISLTANQKYDIKMEYYENGGGAVARLRWSSASQAYGIIPSPKLYSNAIISATGVSVSPTAQSLAVGATLQLTETVSPANATNKAVSYATSDANIATVSASGLVTAIAAGSATITVTTQDGGFTATSAITVVVPATSVAVSPTAQTLAVGATQQLTATVSPANATNKAVTYTTSDAAVATVSSGGLVTAVAAGNATITVTTQDGGFTATSAITVVVPATSVAVNPTAKTLAVDATQQLTATVNPANATNKVVSWSTSNASVATVSTSGLVTAVAVGSATITVTTQDGGFTATSAITVVVPVTSVAVSPTSQSLLIGATQQLTETVNPTNATNKVVSWSTSDAAVATVSTSGLVTAVAAGSATITVTTQDGGFTATSAITVNSAAGDGLKADYYHTKDLTGAVIVSRTDATVNFGWGNGSFETGKNTDNFSARWTGQVKPQYSQLYTFETETDDGVRLWVNGTLLVDKWVNQSPTKWTGTINLTANQKYDIKMEYFENGGGAVARLRWSSSSQALEVIPQSRLYSNSTPVAVTGVSVSPSSATITAGGGTQLTATVAPANATNKTVSWSSSNTSVATVNSSGLVTAVAEGNATITVTTQDGSFTATSAITVNAPVAGSVVYAVNAGGAAYTALDGTVFEADRYFTGGSTYTTGTTTIANTADDELYRSERYGNMSYEFPVTNGDYTVTLKFAEIYMNGTGKRQFDVAIEGVQSVSNLDIFAAAGGNYTAYDVIRDVTVTDGKLNIALTTDIDNAKISAILVKTSSALKKAEVATVNVEKGPKFDVYPSPASNFLTIESDNEGETLVSVLNIYGKQMLVSKHFGKFKSVIDISSFPSGIYIVKAISNGREDVKKIIVE